MQQSQTLFSHLAARFVTQQENLATESLNYILNRSSVAKHAFLRFLTQMDIEFTDDLTFRTQVSGADKAIPDLVGIDSAGREVLVIEAKFWAGLTENQPVAYLRRLPPEVDAVLLFLAPARRFPTLWNELLRRCRETGLAVEEADRGGTEFLARQVNHKHVLALASWRLMLSFILRSLETEGQGDVASDVGQLAGFCESLDATAFLPLHSEELTGNVGTRIEQYCQLVDEVIGALDAEGTASIVGRRSGGGLGYYGRSITLGDFTGYLHFSCRRWRTLAATPLWVHLYGPNWTAPHGARERLLPLDLETPPRLFQTTDALVVPLYLPTGVEKQAVVAALLAQVRELAGYLRGAPRPAPDEV